jgi:hypothetical protein
MPHRQECIVKASSLISTVLLALSLTGAAQAQSAGSAPSNVAPAIIELAQCDAHSAAPCGFDAADAAKANETDIHALPPADPKHPRKADPVTPVPEPQTFVMLMLGLVVLGFASRRNGPTEKFKD